jgi:hypothetical protein
VLGAGRQNEGSLSAGVPRIDRYSPDETKDKKKQKGKQKEKQSKPRKNILSPALFDWHTMMTRFGQNNVEVLPFKDLLDFIHIVHEKFANKVVVRDPSSSKGRASARLPFQLDELIWANGDMRPGNIYKFKGQIFYCGLLVLPIYSYGAVQPVPIPPVNEIIPFAESCIDPDIVDRLLGQLHWQIGDRLSRADGVYKVTDIHVESGTVSVVNVPFPPVEETTRGYPLIITLTMSELQRKFLSGDGVVVVAGYYKGLTGSVLHDEQGILHVLTEDDGTYVSIVNRSILMITDTLSCH